MRSTALATLIWVRARSASLSVRVVPARSRCLCAPAAELAALLEQWDDQAAQAVRGERLRQERHAEATFDVVLIDVPDMHATGRSGRCSASTSTTSNPSMPGIERSVSTTSIDPGAAGSAGAPVSPSPDIHHAADLRLQDAPHQVAHHGLIVDDERRGGASSDPHARAVGRTPHARSRSTRTPPPPAARAGGSRRPRAGNGSFRAAGDCPPLR